MATNYGAWTAGMQAAGSGSQNARLLSDIMDTRRRRQQEREELDLRRQAMAPVDVSMIPGAEKLGPIDPRLIGTLPYILGLRGGAKSTAGGGSDRGIAALLSVGYPKSAANRMQSVPNALELHNALIDLNKAYNEAKSGADPSRVRTMLESMAAENRYLLPLMGGTGDPLGDIEATYATVRTLAAMEVPRLTYGSTAKPPEPEIAKNRIIYPELHTPTPQFQARMNAIAHSQILPALAGAEFGLRVIRSKAYNPQTRQAIADVTSNIADLHRQTMEHIKRMPGTRAGEYVPGNVMEAPGTVDTVKNAVAGAAEKAKSVFSPMKPAKSYKVLSTE